VPRNTGGLKTELDDLGGRPCRPVPNWSLGGVLAYACAIG